MLWMCLVIFVVQVFVSLLYDTPLCFDKMPNVMVFWVLCLSWMKIQNNVVLNFCVWLNDSYLSYSTHINSLDYHIILRFCLIMALQCTLVWLLHMKSQLTQNELFWSKHAKASFVTWSDVLVKVLFLSFSSCTAVL